MPSSGQYGLLRLERRSSRPSASSRQASPAFAAGSGEGKGSRRRLPLATAASLLQLGCLPAYSGRGPYPPPSDGPPQPRCVPGVKEAWLMKTIWKGAISFGLVTIPVRVYGATEEKSLRFHQLHAPDGGRIRYKRVCAADGEEVDFADIVKGYEYEKDHYVTLTEEHLATLRLRDNVFVLETMYWPDEIRVPSFEVLDESVELRQQEIRMARSLIDSLTDAFKPDEFHDEYRAALEDLVTRKIQGEEITYTEEAEPSKVVDLMEALKASVEAAKSGKPSAERKAGSRRRKRAAGE